jgi:hypothetical protein
VTTEVTFWNTTIHKKCKKSFDGCLTQSERNIYLNKNSPSIPCGYLIPTELDIIRTYYSQDTVCEIVVVAAIFGGYDSIPNMVDKKKTGYMSYPNICYILFVDIDTLKLVEQTLKNVLNKSTPWKIYVMNTLTYDNPAKTMKSIKLSLHRLFPNAKWILYFDAKYQLLDDPLVFIKTVNELMSVNNHSFAIFKGRFDGTIENQFIGARKRLIYLHNSKLIHNIKIELKELDIQYKLYKDEGYFNIIKDRTDLLIDSAIILYKQHQNSNIYDMQRFFCAWNNEVLMFSRRDQLSYAYVEYKLGIQAYKFSPKMSWKWFQNIGHAHPVNRSEILGIDSIYKSTETTPDESPTV